MDKLRVGNSAVIRYFNPGHESAVLNASRYYHPPANQLVMQTDLAFLPAWYAQVEDWILVEKPLPEIFLSEIQLFLNPAKPVALSEITDFPDGTIDLWGISPQSVHFFEQLNQTHSLNLQIPEWKKIYRPLGSRWTAHAVLSELIRAVPGIESILLPRRFSNLESLEFYLLKSGEQQLVKSPYSSSGRGLVWLPPEQISRSERQIIQGMLNKQGEVSIEKALDKRLDFSLHFEISDERETAFIGYSVFQTNPKGVYKKSVLASQEILEKMITGFIAPTLLQQIRIELIRLIDKKYAPHYVGCVGVDMLVYASGNKYKLHPCVEINMRKSMGYLAICLFEQFLCPETQGDFFVEYHSVALETNRKHQELKRQYPLYIQNHRIESGYLNLCPVTEGTHYHAYLIISPASRILP